MNAVGIRSLACAAVLACALAVGCGGGRASVPLPVPDVEVSLEPAELSVAPDTTGIFTATLRPLNGFAGPVDLAVDAQGTDLAGSVTPAVIVLGADPKTAVISVRVPVSASAGGRALALHVRGASVQQDVVVSVSVPAARLLPISTFVNSTQANLAFMAFKDGDAGWRLLDGTGGAYNAAVTDPAGRYGLAYGYNCSIGTFQAYQMNYIFQTLPESSSLGVYFICDPPPGPTPVLYSLQGRIQGQGAGSGYLVTSAAALLFQGGANSYLTQVLEGKGDLAGWLFSDPDTQRPTRLFLDRGRDAQGDAVRDVDFAADGFDPGPPQPIAYGPVGADETIQGIVRYFTSSGQYFGLGEGPALPSYAAFPAERSVSGDSYGYAFRAAGTDHGETVYGGASGLPGPLSISFPTPVPPITVDWLPGTYRRPGLTWSSVSPLPRLEQFSMIQSVNREQVYWYLLFSAGWLGAGAHAVQAPDFTGFAGWDDRWGFRAGFPVSVDHGQFGSIGGAVASATEKGTAGAMRLLGQEAGARWPGFLFPDHQHGGFRVVGLASTLTQTSYAATRHLLTTP